MNELQVTVMELHQKVNVFNPLVPLLAQQTSCIKIFTTLRNMARLLLLVDAF